MKTKVATTVTEAVLTIEQSPLAELLKKPYVPPAETRRAKPLPKRLRKPKPVEQLPDDEPECSCGLAMDMCMYSTRRKAAADWAEENGYEIDGFWETYADDED